MARPEVQGEPAVEEGVCFALFAYDAGLGINLDGSEGIALIRRQS